MFKKLQTTLNALTVTSFLTLTSAVYAQNPNVQVDKGQLKVPILSFGGLLTFAIRAFFVIAGLAALFYLLLGAFAWVTSGGEKANVQKAQDKIRDAVVGLIIIVVVIALVATLEQIVFDKTLCLGLTCPVSIPKLTEFNQF